VDSSSTTRWSSSFTNNQWWQVDLGRTRGVNSVSLNWEAAYASRYDIRTSTDGTIFTTAATVTLTAPGWKTTTFTTRNARYVRVVGVTRATQFGISFWDARVQGPAD
jgi:cytochrome c